MGRHLVALCEEYFEMFRLYVSPSCVRHTLFMFFVESGSGRCRVVASLAVGCCRCSVPPGVTGSGMKSLFFSGMLLGFECRVNFPFTPVPTLVHLAPFFLLSLSVLPEWCCLRK